jgi:hypothetical protein
LELLAQVCRGLLEFGDAAAELFGVAGAAEAAGAEDLLAERLRQAPGELVTWLRSRWLWARRLARSASSDWRLTWLVRGSEASGWVWAARSRIWARRSWWR